MRPARNPSVAGLPCAICGRPAQSFCHITHRGMGGDPLRLRTEGFPACGVDHYSPGHHRDYALNLYKARICDGVLEIKRQGEEWFPAPYWGRTFDEIGESA